jgi:hypothetical protein
MASIFTVEEEDKQETTKKQLASNGTSIGTLPTEVGPRLMSCYESSCTDTWKIFKGA